MAMMTKAQIALGEAMDWCSSFEGVRLRRAQYHLTPGELKEFEEAERPMPLRSDPDVSFDPAYMLAAVRHISKELDEHDRSLLEGADAFGFSERQVFGVLNEIAEAHHRELERVARERAKCAQTAWVNFWKQQRSEDDVNDPHLTMRAWRAVVEALK